MEFELVLDFEFCQRLLDKGISNVADLWWMDSSVHPPSKFFGLQSDGVSITRRSTLQGDPFPVRIMDW
jgi:hypothetical protein